MKRSEHDNRDGGIRMIQLPNDILKADPIGRRILALVQKRAGLVRIQKGATTTTTAQDEFLEKVAQIRLASGFKKSVADASTEVNAVNPGLYARAVDEVKRGIVSKAAQAGEADR
jgi:hypothetical protein